MVNVVSLYKGYRQKHSATRLPFTLFESRKE